jgi:hypothetical protein
MGLDHGKTSSGKLPALAIPLFIGLIARPYPISSAQLISRVASTGKPDLLFDSAPQLFMDLTQTGNKRPLRSRSGFERSINEVQNRRAVETH